MQSKPLGNNNAIASSGTKGNATNNNNNSINSTISKNFIESLKAVDSRSAAIPPPLSPPSAGAVATGSRTGPSIVDSISYPLVIDVLFEQHLQQQPVEVDDEESVKEDGESIQHATSLDLDDHMSATRGGGSAMVITAISGNNSAAHPSKTVGAVVANTGTGFGTSNTNSSNLSIAKAVPSITVTGNRNPLRLGGTATGGGTGVIDADTESEISSISDIYYPSVPSNFLRVRTWDKKKLYSDMVRDGLLATRQSTKNIVMLFESPSCSTHETSFFNGQTFKYYDYPPSPPVYKSVLAPCRYSMMNGSVYPSYLLDDAPPDGLIDHWEDVIPNFVSPFFVSEIENVKRSTVYAYLPVEHIPNHVNNPHVHYHVSGKDILHLMTRRTPKLLTNTRDRRPCICKTTHSMGSKGIFVIRNDEDEKRFESILSETGNPTFVVTEYIDTIRSLSCHFFIHPNSNEITWFGSNENRQTTKGAFSHDTIIVMNEQEKLRQMQMQIVKDVVKYFQARDFWGFCGIDVLFDRNGVGYLVDVNPRVTGSSPAIMVAHRLHDKFGFENCIFRRGCRYAFAGSSKQLMNDVSEFNRVHENEMLILVTGFVQIDSFNTFVQMAVYGRKSLEECEAVLNSFAPLMKSNTAPTISTTTAATQARNKQ